MRKPLVAGNWKLNGNLSSNEDLIDGILESLAGLNADMLVCPSFVHLASVLEKSVNTSLMVGAQDASQYESGAYTGEVSAAMLKDLGASHVILGHSERRTLFGDDDAMVAQKFERALAAGLIPILCVGETLAERESEQTEAVVARQLQTVLDQVDATAWSNVVIAYEPVWAIGTGKTASPEQAQQVHAFIRQRLQSSIGEAAQGIRILYGGSVKPQNAAELFAQQDIDGGLIGGASLIAADFIAIAKAAA